MSEPLPRRGIVVLSTTDHPSNDQRRRMGQAAADREVRWLAYSRDFLHPRGWRLHVEASAQAAASRRRSIRDSARDRLGTLARASARRGARAGVQVALWLPAGWRTGAKRQARRLPPPAQDRLRQLRALVLGRRLRAASSAKLLDVVLDGPLANGSPELLVATDRHAASVAWSVVQQRPDVTAIQGMEQAIRFLRLAAEAKAPTLDWAGLVGEADDLDLVAALPVLDPPRPHAVVLRTDGSRPFLQLGRATLTVSPSPDQPLDDLVAALGPGLVDASAAEAAAAPSSHLLIAPSNYAGQSTAWARAVETHLPGVTARSLHVTKASLPFAFPCDFPLTTLEWERPEVRARMAVEAVLPASHVLLESMRPILACDDPAARNGWDFAAGRADVEALRDSGRQVALLFHGSEIRRPMAHAERYAFSPFGLEAAASLTRGLLAATEKVHRLLADYSGQVFVSTLDLLDDLPEATWLPVVVGQDAFRPAPPALERAKPVVVHAPSSPLLKGSATVDSVLTELARQGVVEYRRLEGVPSAFVLDFLREADVVIDQVVLGNPGVLAAEAMAAGRVVVAHLSAAVRARFPIETPVVEATPEILEDVVRDICADRARYVEVAAAGPGFARALHSGEASARALAGFLAGSAAQAGSAPLGSATPLGSTAVAVGAPASTAG